MEKWLQTAWFFDWLTITLPNGRNGKGERRRADPSEVAEAARLTGTERVEAMRVIHYEDRMGEEEAREARDAFCLWSVLAGLHTQRVGNGTDGFAGALHYADSPIDEERRATVRAGHARNMPSLEIPGGDGRCALLAPQALNAFGPSLLARADVSMDHSQEGLMDALLDYARRMSKASKMAAPRVIESDTGRTFYWGKGEASVKVYQKDLERVADGKLAIEDADPHLVRVEFRFSPKSDKKAGAAGLARNGAWRLLGTVHWVRSMVEQIAALIEVEKGASMAVQRVIKAPDARTVEDKAAYGLEQYARTFCKAAVSRIVAEKFGHDWMGAEVSPEEVRAAVLDMVAAHLDMHGTAEAVVVRAGLDEARDAEAEAMRGAAILDFWMARQHRAAEEAQSGLKEAAASARFEAGQDGDGVSSSGDGRDGSGTVSATVAA
ncbi:hypothetical protein [Ketogulonicigenium robustum]|nr:hypothetical protein [Ketogulonicigenium robustum]